MCNWIILFLLFCNGNGGSFLSGNSNTNNGCGCGNNNNRGGRGGYDDRDWDYDRNRSGNTPPPWVRSNYSNGDTCGCEEQ